MAKIQELLDRLPPETALMEIAAVLHQLLPAVSEEGRLEFVKQIIGGGGDDKVTSMVHLWLAECLDEGVDPTHMCQSLVERVAQSKQLMAVSDPDLLVLFEDWLDELEAEVISLAPRQEVLTPQDLAQQLGLSQRGATFLISKLHREGKLS